MIERDKLNKFTTARYFFFLSSDEGARWSLGQLQFADKCVVRLTCAIDHLPWPHESSAGSLQFMFFTYARSLRYITSSGSSKQNTFVLANVFVTHRNLLRTQRWEIPSFCSQRLIFPIADGWDQDERGEKKTQYVQTRENLRIQNHSCNTGNKNILKLTRVVHLWGNPWLVYSRRNWLFFTVILSYF